MPVFFRHAAAFQMLREAAVANLEPLAAWHETLHWKTLCRNTGPCTSFLKTIYVNTCENQALSEAQRRGGNNRNISGKSTRANQHVHKQKNARKK